MINLSFLINNDTKKVMRLAIPMAITQLITMGSGFLCMSMLAKLGHNVLAASALIFSISVTLLILSGSILFSLSILVGHSYGERDYLNVGNLMQQGWFLALILSVPTMILYWNIYPILIFAGQDKNIAEIVSIFFHANIWRVLPFFLSVCNQQLCYGVHKQKIDMYANLLGVIVLVLSAYTLIFGNWGFPRLGVVGFAYASTLQGLFYFLFTTLCLYFVPHFKQFELFQLRLGKNWHALRRLFRIGWPISLQISSEVFSFTVATTFIGWLGSSALAAFQVILQYQFLTVVPIFGISQASGVLISQALGSKDYISIKKLGTESLKIVGVISLFTGLLFISFPRLLSSVYLNINDPINANILHLIAILLMIMAFSQFFDAFRNVLTGVLRGLLDTRFPMLIGLVSIWVIALPLGYFLAFNWQLGATGIVIGSALGMFVGAIILYQRWRALSSKFVIYPSEEQQGEQRA